MGTESKLLEIADDIAVSLEQTPRSADTRQAPQTGPGQMLQFREQILAAEGELRVLGDELNAFAGANATRHIDPQCIEPSAWANRHQDAYRTPEFERLKSDIAYAEGNVQPIAVRPHPSKAGRFEIIFGHRRHSACLQLKLPVLATIFSHSFSDQQLFAAMERENRVRANLSPFEQGTMYKRALESGLYPSKRRLAEALGVSHTWVNNAMRVAELPDDVLKSFRSVLEIQPKHARTIWTALTNQTHEVLARARTLATSDTNLSAGKVVAALVGEVPDTSQDSREHQLTVHGKVAGIWRADADGTLNIRIVPGKEEADEWREALMLQLSKVLMALTES